MDAGYRTDHPGVVGGVAVGLDVCEDGGEVRLPYHLLELQHLLQPGGVTGIGPALHVLLHRVEVGGVKFPVFYLGDGAEHLRNVLVVRVFVREPPEVGLVRVLHHAGVPEVGEEGRELGIAAVVRVVGEELFHRLLVAGSGRGLVVEVGAERNGALAVVVLRVRVFRKEARVGLHGIRLLRVAERTVLAGGHQDVQGVVPVGGSHVYVFVELFLVVQAQDLAGAGGFEGGEEVRQA